MDLNKISDAATIYDILIRKQFFSEKTNSNLFLAYKNDDDIKEIVSLMAEKAFCTVDIIEDSICIIPYPNSPYALSSAEFNKKIVGGKTANMTTESYKELVILGNFVVLIIFDTIEARKNVDINSGINVYINELINDIELRLNVICEAFKGKNDGLFEYYSNILTKYRNMIPEAGESNKTGAKTKSAFVEKVIKGLESLQLVTFSQDDGRLSPTDFMIKMLNHSFTISNKTKYENLLHSMKEEK